ncbi:MAG: divalent-cation tolerance protein CutA [Acidobacteriota bacterium]|nr:divalent-cation tolerance protein CutA [Acidobacteriota bacterium]
MPDSACTVRIVLTTASSAEEAQRIARTLVEERLAACTTILPAALSIYRWHGEIESAHESLILIKTSNERLAALEERLHALHSYDVPEFLVLNVDFGSQTYLAWLQASLQ